MEGKRASKRLPICEKAIVIHSLVRKLLGDRLHQIRWSHMGHDLGDEADDLLAISSHVKETHDGSKSVELVFSRVLFLPVFVLATYYYPVISWLLLTLVEGILEGLLRC